MSDSNLIWERVFKLEALVEMLRKDQKVQTKINAELIRLLKEK